MQSASQSLAETTQSSSEEEVGPSARSQRLFHDAKFTWKFTERSSAIKRDALVAALDGFRVLRVLLKRFGKLAAYLPSMAENLGHLFGCLQLFNIV